MHDLRDQLVEALAPDRDTRAAFCRGAAVILAAIAVTLTFVGALTTACGGDARWLLLGLPALVPAAACAIWARVLRSRR